MQRIKNAIGVICMTPAIHMMLVANSLMDERLNAIYYDGLVKAVKEHS